MKALILLLPILLTQGKWTLEQARDLRTAAQVLRADIDLAKDGSRFEQSCAFALQGVFDACEQAGGLFVTKPGEVDGILDDALRCYNMVAVARGKAARKIDSKPPESLEARSEREAKEREAELAKIDKELALLMRLNQKAADQIEALEGYIERRKNSGGRGPNHISEAKGKIRSYKNQIIKNTNRIAELKNRRHEISRERA